MARRVTDPADALFLAFQQVPRPSAVVTCECCYSTQEQAEALAPVPLRELPGSVIYDLAGYLWHANRLVNGVDRLADHVRYFTPRLLIDPLGPDWTFPEPELLTRRIRIAGFDTWPAPLRDAVRDYLHAAWARIIRSPAGNPKLRNLLAAIGEIEPDVTPYLEEWTGALGEPAAARQLEWLLNGVAFGNDFWQRPAARFTSGLDVGQVNAWLGTLGESVVRAWLDSTDDEARQVLESIEPWMFPTSSGS